MYEYDRLREILNILSENKSASVQMLAERLYVSAATVRRDLNVLEKQGQVRRVFGGVVLMENDIPNTAFHGRSTRDAELDKIALLAVNHIKDGDVIMLDASSSACAIIPFLKQFKNLTIVTNSTVSTTGLQELDANVFITGGYMPRHSQGYVGNYAETMLHNFWADTFFFSCAGLSMEGRISDATNYENSIRRVMLKQSARHILLCDSPKFGRNFCYTIADMSEIDVLISDAPFSGAGREKQYL